MTSGTEFMFSVGQPAAATIIIGLWTGLLRLTRARSEMQEEFARLNKSKKLLFKLREELRYSCKKLNRHHG